LTSTFNLETGCNKICDVFDHVEFNKMADSLKWMLDYFI
jgi:hypothetical protein